MRFLLAISTLAFLLAAGCAGPATEDAVVETPPAAAAEPITILLEDCLSLNGYLPLRERVYETGEYTSHPPGLTSAAGYQQAIKAHAFTCPRATRDGADVGALSGAFVAVHIEEVPEVHGVSNSDGQGLFLPLQIVLSPGPIHDLVAGLGFPVVDGTADVQELPVARTAAVDGPAAFSMTANLVDPGTDLTSTGFASEDLYIGPAGWLSFVADCIGPSGTSAIVVESGSSMLQQAGPVLHGSNSQDQVCSLDLVFTSF